MIIKNSQQDIHIVEDESTTTLGYKVSGGADSAIVGYMLSKFVVEELNAWLKVSPFLFTRKTSPPVNMYFILAFAVKTESLTSSVEYNPLAK